MQGYRLASARVGPFPFTLGRRGRTGRHRTRWDREHDGGTATGCAVDLGPAAETACAFDEAADAKSWRRGQSARVETSAVVGDLERDLILRCEQLHRDARRVRMLGDIRERFLG